MEAVITFIRCTKRLSGALDRNGVPVGTRIRSPASPPGTPYSPVPTVTGVVHLYAIRGIVYGPDVRSEQEDPATVPRTVYVEHSLSHHHHAPRAAHSCESPASPGTTQVNLRFSGDPPGGCPTSLHPECGRNLYDRSGRTKARAIRASEPPLAHQSSAPPNYSDQSHPQCPR